MRRHVIRQQTVLVPYTAARMSGSRRLVMHGIDCSACDLGDSRAANLTLQTCDNAQDGSGMVVVRPCMGTTSSHA